MEKEYHLDTKEFIPKNLRTNFDETIEAIREIEGKYWEGDSDVHGIEAAKRFLAYTKKDADPAKVFTLYGIGGYNRYYVYPNGEVWIDSYQTKPAVLEKSRELGFQIL